MRRPVSFSGTCKLIVSDVDYTFVASDKHYVQENLDAVAEAAALGIPFAFVTGRCWISMRQVVKNMHLTVPQAMDNGATIIDPVTEKVLYSGAFGREDFLKLLVIFKESGFFFCVANSNDMYSLGMTEEARIHLQKHSEISILISEEEMIAHADTYLKVAFLEPKRDAEVRKYVKEELPRRLKEAGLEIDVTFSEIGVAVITRKGIDKLSAVERISKMIGCTTADVLATGDGDNDAGMLNGVGIGAAMANATSVCKQAASYIAVADNDHGGVAEAIRKFALK